MACIALISLAMRSLALSFSAKNPLTSAIKSETRVRTLSSVGLRGFNAVGLRGLNVVGLRGFIANLDDFGEDEVVDRSVLRGVEIGLTGISIFKPKL